MERTSANRKLARRRFSLIVKNLEDLLKDNTINEVYVQFKRLKIAFDTLISSQNQYFEVLLENGVSDEQIDQELEQSGTYEIIFYNLEEKINNLLSSEHNDTQSVKCRNNKKENKPERHFQLPRLELPKFNGEIKQWLVFWAQFQKIHLDDNIDNDDKFQYLVQSMEEGSSAKELVMSFPPTGENYPKVVEQLKRRFAQDELLIEHYVRELLQLVITQTKTGAKMATRSLYDKLMTQIIALESMGITKDKYAAFLYPMVESALPEETLRAWNRSSYNCISTDDKDKSNLCKLLEFIRSEVESEERIRLSRSSFLMEELMMTAPTASFLAETVKKSVKPEAEGESSLKKIKQKNCIWCDKTHMSSECYAAQRMTLEERKGLLKKKRACFRCLCIGHNVFSCRKSLRCLICSRSHHPIMCPDVIKSTESREKDEKPIIMKQVIKHSTVLLQTVCLKIVHNGKAIIVRALLDSGAQRSFVRSDVIEMLQIQSDSYEKLQHNLFGGAVTKLKNHRAFVLNCQSIDGKYEFLLDALENKVICDELPKVGPGELSSELKNRGIILSDCVNDVSVISLLIGSNVLGSLYTGRTVHVSDNLVAIETKLGWTVQGPTVGRHSCSVNFNSTKTSFDVDLQNSKLLEIRDETSVKSNEKIEKYEVEFPWKESGNILSSTDDLKVKSRLKLFINDVSYDENCNKINNQLIVRMLRKKWRNLEICYLVKKVLRECIKCKRYKACALSPTLFSTNRVQCV
ncbi:hypothetical protein K1T71_002517 [Dendrolimus kikuchii]|uniref:Uncharacterized protein n=1 Tax=Dendrolimus kikuchii TaxID=765133 RepID=A0ACC1DDA6_9NEOP|nr:hypothetical protein K1T71_002517 [Dendrolimus kikuchii]